MKKIIFILAALLPCAIYAQEQPGVPVNFLDSLGLQELDEVILISNALNTGLKEAKALGSIDDYLEQSNTVNMIRRGAYAWEPMLNGMASERGLITVDGMRIYQACTDKMDPVTSYVENTNLARAKVNDGQSGAVHGGTISGSIDLERRKSGFSLVPDFAGSVFSGFETNNEQQIYGSTLSYSDPDFFTDIDFTFRDAGNYKAGRKSGSEKTVDFSQFTKYNLSAIAGYKINDKNELEASLIFDKATDVGYPGLAMDVALARAFIASVNYTRRHLSENIHLWETKAYFNTITHVMDDSSRPVVPIRMDMPGWSKTQGFYSKIKGAYGLHRITAILSGHRNNSLAEMTMYPENSDEADMFMLTWPDVNTLYAGINLEDDIRLNAAFNLKISGGMGFHQNEIRSEFGLSSLQIFYPELTRFQPRILKNINTELTVKKHRFTHQFRVGYGDRAPSVSEAYGFYLFNTNDNYDYVGNPFLKNEKSVDLGIGSTYESTYFTAGLKASYFHLTDYIIGKPQPDIPPMNVTASGIKVYQQLANADIFNLGLDLDYYWRPDFVFSARASYRYGQGSANTRLPLIQPFNYEVKLQYDHGNFLADIAFKGGTRNRSSIEFGEEQKSGYGIVDLHLSQNFKINNQDLLVKLGAENIFDKYYSTFDDWMGIPRMGRNIFANIIYRF